MLSQLVICIFQIDDLLLERGCCLHYNTICEDIYALAISYFQISN
jgi:hypothetical protein